MPQIYDNIDQSLLPALKRTLEHSQRADFCVGYFNLRGWKLIDHLVEPWSGADGSCCRLMIGMQGRPEELLRSALSLTGSANGLDNQAVLQLNREAAAEFREQLQLGAPTNADEEGLRRLSAQLRARKVVVKLFLRYPLHAKLYLLHRDDYNAPIVGFLGSSNLTFAGLSRQGELNIDVLDQQACDRLQIWFDERWNDRWCLDISHELAEIIDTSWAREQDPPPYHIYLKIAYHLSQEARTGINEFRIPKDLDRELLPFQKAAVQIAAHHLNTRGGVLIGDVVGLGKTLMATALARIMQDDHGTDTLIICPVNLVPMWQEYVDRYRLLARVLPSSQAIGKLPELKRYRVVLIDESHNLRNREGKRYRAIQEYIRTNESSCILLSATPYNKTYLDLSSQLRLFVPEGQDLGIRPDKQIEEIGETEFIGRHQCGVRTLAAFEKSEYPDDWRELMRLYMVRRTRGFIQANYAETDPQSGRKYLTLGDGARSYFPARVPRTAVFDINEKDPGDPYARLYSQPVIDAVNGLSLPRYGLGNYVAAKPAQRPNAEEKKQFEGLGRAGKRLMGFCRTNLFKRLESGGPAFLQSIERHILRNYVFVHAIEQGLPLPLGTQGAELLDPGLSDEDDGSSDYEHDNQMGGGALLVAPATTDVLGGQLRERAAAVYQQYAARLRSRFTWVRPVFFNSQLRTHLLQDAEALTRALHLCGEWAPDRDAKMLALLDLLARKHPREKVLVFTQFADTAHYLARELKARGVEALEEVTGDSEDPTSLAWRFSPRSNNKEAYAARHGELRALIATDVLSEGQNLQDCSIIVSYDLPWAIIRLIQRAGRVDRIGQTSEDILCYSFLPADGIERIIRLRARVRQRLRENEEVVGAGETFFEDDMSEQALRDIYTEKSGIMDGDADTEVDLASQAYQIWKNATDADPRLRKIIPDLPNVVYSTRAHEPGPAGPEGVLVYTRTAAGSDALAWIDRDGKPVTQSQLAILQAAACHPDTPAIPRQPEHHELVRKGVEHLVEEEKQVGGQLGRPSGARFRTYERLKKHAEAVRGTIFDTRELHNAIQSIYAYPLRPSAVDTLNRQLRSGISDQQLAELVIGLHDEDRLSEVSAQQEQQEPHIICSLGLARPSVQGH
ncbi:MAG: phospholipase D-like domain-containing protein [Chloroflexota bacterium]|nr:phospholipase D-like domain-containing protein [Chloroflexota bacterium]